MTVLEARRTTLADFEVMMKAHQKTVFDNLYNLHLNAWLQNQVKATNSRGEPYYREFKDFFNYEEQLAQIDDYAREEKERELRDKKQLMEMIKRANA